MNSKTKTYTLESLKESLRMTLQKDFSYSFLEGYLDKESIDKYINNIKINTIRQIAIIESMTCEEKMKPSILDGSRLQRIANGSGQETKEIYLLLKQYKEIKKMILKCKSKPTGKEPPPAIAAKMPILEFPIFTDAIARKYSG